MAGIKFWHMCKSIVTKNPLTNEILDHFKYVSVNMKKGQKTDRP